MNERLDVVLVKRGLVASRQVAGDLIANSSVTVNGAIASKASRQIKPNDQVVIHSKPKYVSRGGLKLEGALDQFGLQVEGLRVLDAGSSTGGFTDCLLSFGARSVFAVDVGTNQLHEKLRADPRVHSFEQTNIRDFRDPKGTGFDMVVADLSFTSVRALAPHLVNLCKGDLVILVKPQFEVGNREVSKAKGVIKKPELWRDSLLRVGLEFEHLGCVIKGVTSSVIRGSRGNVEFFFWVSNSNPLNSIALEKSVEIEINKLVTPSV